MSQHIVMSVFNDVCYIIHKDIHIMDAVAHSLFEMCMIFAHDKDAADTKRGLLTFDL